MYKNFCDHMLNFNFRSFTVTMEKIDFFPKKKENKCTVLYLTFLIIEHKQQIVDGLIGYPDQLIINIWL